MVSVSALSVVCLLCFIGGSWSMTREQLKKTARAMKMTCMPKNQVTEEMVGNIEGGQFLEDKKVMCYIACVYQMIGVVKNGKMDSDAALKQIDILYPTEVKEPAKKAVAVCGDIGKKYNDICEAAYWSAKCMYDTDPVNFIFA